MHHDVLIVGAGAVGLSIARRLARQGASVLVLDGRGPAGGASSGNAGMVCPSHVIPLAAPGMVALGLKYLLDPRGPFRLTPRLDPALWGWLWRFARHCSDENVRKGLPVLRDLLLRSRALVEAEAADLGGFSFEAKGLLMIAETAAGRAGLDHERHIAIDAGLEARALSQGDLGALDAVLADVPHGLFFPGDAHLEPAAYTLALAADLTAHGGRVQRADVRAIRFEGDHFAAVVTDEGEIRAEVCALAAGAWTARMLRPHGISIPLEAGRGCSLTYAANPGGLGVPLILTEARVAVTPMAGRLRLAGTMELSGLEERVAPHRLHALAEAFTRVFPRVSLPPVAEATPWVGLRPCSPDGLPYLGFARPGLFVATGHAMLGISLAAVTGELGAEMIRGDRPSLAVAALDPLRFT